MRGLAAVRHLAVQHAAAGRHPLHVARTQHAVRTSMVAMLERLIGENIELSNLLAPELGVVKVDPSQLEQVVMNLIVNARDAMPKGGRIKIETCNVDLDYEPSPHQSTLPPGSYVVLIVKDTGCGMDRETMSHLFEPFFTTKETGKGTGLGLATIYGIVKQNNGHIQVASKPGVGTRFAVYLPRVQEHVHRKESKPAVNGVMSAQGTILVVEDEEAVRIMAVRRLRSNGYTVLEAQNGQEAMLVADAYAGTIDLLVTDVIMPLMSGPMLATKLLARRPQMKVLYMSGYTDSLLAPHDEQDIKGAFLQKPFTPNSLADAVGRAMPASPFCSHVLAEARCN